MTTTTHPVDSTFCPACQCIGTHADGCSAVLRDSVLPTSTAHRLEVERFTLTDGPRTVYYEVPGTDTPDLSISCREALGGGSHAGIVLVSLGIDGHNMHRVQVESGYPMLEPDEVDRPDLYDGGKCPVELLTEAIAAMTAIRDQLARMAGAQ